MSLCLLVLLVRQLNKSVLCITVGACCLPWLPQCVDPHTWIWSVDKDLAGWSHSKSSGQWLKVQEGSSDKSIPQGLALGPALILCWWHWQWDQPTLSWRFADDQSSGVWCVWWTHWKGEMPSRGTWIGFRTVPVWNSWSLLIPEDRKIPPLPDSAWTRSEA